LVLIVWWCCWLMRHQ